MHVYIYIQSIDLAAYLADRMLYYIEKSNDKLRYIELIVEARVRNIIFN